MGDTTSVCNIYALTSACALHHHLGVFDKNEVNGGDKDQRQGAPGNAVEKHVLLWCRNIFSCRTVQDVRMHCRGAGTKVYLRPTPSVKCAHAGRVATNCCGCRQNTVSPVQCLGLILHHVGSFIEARKITINNNGSVLL